MLHERSTPLNDTRRKVVRLGAALGCGVGLALVLLAALGAAGDPPALAAPLANPAPALVAVTPAQAYNDLPTVITITGSDFALAPTAYLNHAWLEDVGFVDAATLTATVPADLPGGAYTLTVTNPDGQSASLANAFTVDWAGDGTQGEWQTLTATMTTARASFGAVSADGSIYAIGGTTGDGYLDTVERAVIHLDGTLGAWQMLTATMSTARIGFAAVEANGYIYVIGGVQIPKSGGSYRSNSVERARLQADGSLGAWQVLTATLNISRSDFGAVATEHFIYAAGGLVEDPRPKTVERAAINADGTLGAWEILTATLNNNRVYAPLVQAAGSIYAIGGDDLTISRQLDTVEQAVINPDGTLGDWHMSTSLPGTRIMSAAVLAGGCLHVTGGYGPGLYPDLNSVDQACLDPNGTLGLWQTLPSTMNVTRMLHTAVYARGSIYAIGGSGGSVERVMVSPPTLYFFMPSIVPPGRPTTVTVWGNNLVRPAALRLPDNTPLALTAGTPYSFTATIPAGLGLGWYTATVTLQNRRAGTTANLFEVNSLLDLPPVSYFPMVSFPGCGDFFDNFSVPSSGWPVYDDGWRAASYVNGEYQVVSKVPGYFWFSFAPTCLRHNYIVEVDARWVVDDDVGSDYGLIFGRNPSGQYYLFRVSAFYRDFDLLRRDPGTWVTLRPWKEVAAVRPGGDPNHLKVTRAGAQIRLEINGVYVGSWTDGTITGPTWVGLYSTSYTRASYARFDNYRITTLPGTSAPGVMPQSAPAMIGGGQGTAPAVDRDPAPRRDRP